MKTKRTPYAGHDDEGSSKKIEPERVSLRTSVIGKPIPDDELEAIRRWVYEGKR
jgi:hypothetical protein